tara:strand:+ start:623 stop:802 length:180 start_codon:yes stop_codon:yes gene_type:complete
MVRFVSKKKPVSAAKAFGFDHKESPPPDTPDERSEKDDMIQQWLKKNEIKKLPYRKPLP